MRIWLFILYVAVSIPIVSQMKPKTKKFRSDLSMYGNYVPFKTGLPYKTLVFSDFKGKPDGKAAAIIVCATEVEIENRNDSILWTARTIIDADSSFFDDKTQRVLKHEQCHLDICEIYTRKINIFLAQYQKCSPKLEESVEKVVDTFFIAERRQQKLFDKQTRHSTDDYEEYIWEGAIKNELTALPCIK